MKNIGQKKKLCEEKKFRAKNGFGKMHLINVVITYNSRILKFKIQQKVFIKKIWNDTFKCSKFSFYLRKTTV